MKTVTLKQALKRKNIERALKESSEDQMRAIENFLKPKPIETVFIFMIACIIVAVLLSIFIK